MIDENKVIKVINKYNGIVGYKVPQLGVERTFHPKESKKITFNELEKLSFLPGGESILKNYLEITDEDVIMELFNTKLEPEYHYSEQDIKTLLKEGTLDQFLDCLDFAPQGIIDLIKDIAVSLPVNDMAKREAIKEKLGFDVTRAIEIKHTKYDGGDEDDSKSDNHRTGRRAAPIKTGAAPAPTGRRYTSNKE